MTKKEIKQARKELAKMYKRIDVGMLTLVITVTLCCSIYFGLVIYDLIMN